jgi:hypothetical protein
MLLMSGVDAGQVLHGGAKLTLLETLVHKEIVFLMHGSVAALARASKDFEASSQPIQNITKLSLMFYWLLFRIIIFNSGEEKRKH